MIPNFEEWFIVCSVPKNLKLLHPTVNKKINAKYLQKRIELLYNLAVNSKFSYEIDCRFLVYH